MSSPVTPTLQECVVSYFSYVERCGVVCREHVPLQIRKVTFQVVPEENLSLKFHPFYSTNMYHNGVMTMLSKLYDLED